MTSVLFLIPTLDRGGAENVLVDLANHIDQNKFQITVQTLFDQNSQKKRLRKGIEYKTFLYHQFHGNSRLFSLIPAQILYRLIVKKKYDIVVSYLEGPTTHILSGCPYSDTKSVAWVHVEMSNERQLSVGFKSLSDALKGYETFDRIVFVAKTVQDSFRRISGHNFRSELVLYNTINSKRIKEKAQERLTERVFSDKEFNIISVGRIIEAKGYDRLARVQRKLKALGYKTHVFILGTGKEQKELENYTIANGISESFTFLGFQKNPYKYVSAADLFVCSSRREGFSTAVTEALILGVPVVSTNCSGACELLGENNEYGIVTDNDEESLYQGIKELLDDSDLLSHYRKQAKTRGNRFSTKITVGAVENMLTELERNNNGEY